MRKTAVACAAFAALSVYSASAGATSVSSQDQTFTFTGACTDCYDGHASVSATLVLSNYTLGSAIGVGNFVSFTYNGSDLILPFTVTRQLPASALLHQAHCQTSLAPTISL